jgi:hypothetical protein
VGLHGHVGIVDQAIELIEFAVVVGLGHHGASYVGDNATLPVICGRAEAGL